MDSSLGGMPLLVISASSCFCLLIIAALAVGGFVFWRKKQGQQGQQSPGPGAGPGGAAPSSRGNDPLAAIQQQLQGCLGSDVDHEEGRKVLGAALAMVAREREQPGQLDQGGMVRMEQLAGQLESHLEVKKYNPSIMAEFGVDRMQILAALNSHAHRFGTSTTSRILVLMDGQPQAATLEQLWDLAMEHPDRVDLRINQVFGVPAELAHKMMDLSSQRRR